MYANEVVHVCVCVSGWCGTGGGGGGGAATIAATF